MSLKAYEIRAASPWAAADELSDKIVEAVNAELVRMRAAGQVQALQILAGQLLALMALERTMPPDRPASAGRLFAAVREVLDELQQRGPS